MARPGDEGRAAALRGAAIRRRKVDPDALRRWHAAGLTDRQVADLCGASLQAAYYCRKALGLPVNRDGSAKRAGQVGMMAARLRDRAELAARYGLPAWVTPLQLRVLVALASGPLPRDDLAERLGRPGRRYYFLSLSLRRLQRGGLVARQDRYGGRVGSLPSVYLLTPAAMDMLASPKEKETT